MLRTLPVLLVSVVCVLAACPPALAADPPNTVSPSVGFDGDIADAAVSGSTAFLAGSFTSAGRNVGGLMLSDAGSGAQVPPLPPVGGRVNAILPDGSGGWFIGGQWTQIGAQRVAGGLAHLLADGSLDPAFNAPRLNEEVAALALHGTPARLVAGGRFTCAGGNGNAVCGGVTEPAGEIAQHALIAVSPATGALEQSFFGGDAGLSGRVETLTTTATRLIAGGAFSCAIGDGDNTCGGVTEPAGEVARRGLAAYATTGVLDATWSPDVYRTSIPGAGTVYALAVTATQVIVGGTFDCAAPAMTPDMDCTDATEAVRRNVAAFALPGSGEALQAYAPDPSSTVLTLAATAGRVYLGGTFSCLKSDGDLTCGGGGEPPSEVPRDGLAATQLVAAATPEAWNPRLGDAASVYAILPSADGVYISGYFLCTQADTQPRCDDPGEVSRRDAAAFDPVSGATLPWNPSLGGAGTALARAGSGPVAIAGDMRIAGAVPRAGLAAVDLATGALLPWDPMSGQEIDKSSVGALAVSPDGRTVYAAGDTYFCRGYDGDGDCADAGETDLGAFFAIDAASGAVDPGFTPRPAEGPYALAVGPDGTIYGADVFCFGTTDSDCDDPTDVQRPGGLAAVSPAGTLLPWAPFVNDDVNDIAVAGGAVYAVGRFLCAGGTDATCGNEPALEQQRVRGAAFDAGSAALLPWSPAASVGTSLPQSSSVDSVVPDLQRGRVLIAGNFTCLQTSTVDNDCADPGEVVRRSVAGVDPSTGAAQAWGPGSITGLPNTPGEQAPVRQVALTAGTDTVLFAGAVATLEGQGRELMGSLSADSGAGSGWNPGGVGTTYGLTTAPGVAIAHGGFDVAGGSVREGLALFGSHVPPEVIPISAPGTGLDTTRPVITGLKVGRRFRLGRGLVKAAAKKKQKAKVPAGTTVRFILSEQASVRFTVTRKLAGRRSGKRCVAPSKARRKARRCVRTVAVKGSATVAGRAGANRVAFTGRLSRKVTLKPGSYVLGVAATDAAGNRSRTRSAPFTLAPTPRKKRR